MDTLMKAMAILRPGVDCADTNGTLAGIRWDMPSVEPPTQEEVDAVVVRLGKPQVLTAAQMRKALFALGWLPDVKAAIASADGLAEELWNCAATFPRNDEMIVSIAAAIGKTEADLDELYGLGVTFK